MIAGQDGGDVLRDVRGHRQQQHRARGGQQQPQRLLATGRRGAAGRGDDERHAEGPDQGAADLAVSAETPAEGSPGPDHLLVFSPQDFLPDRKNRLASL